MKKLVPLATLAILSLSADYHEPSITFNIDNRDTKFFYQLHLDLHHQSTIELDDSNAIILHGLSQPRANKTCHHELGVGYRRMFEDFGFGTNIVYANQYAHSFFNHNMVPGLELFYKKFMLTFNRYLPVKTSVQMGDQKYLFHDVSEFTLSYRPSKKYEFSVTPHYNHQTKRLGYAGAVSAFVFDNIQLTLTPYCEPQVQHGVTFSVGYHFGGATERVNRKLSKSHRFFYTSNQKEVERFSPSPSPIIMPSSAPIILKPIPQEEKKDPQEQKWWEKFFGIKPKPSNK